MSLKEQIWFFLEDSNTRPAKLVRFFIVLLIFISAGTAIIEFARPELLSTFHREILLLEYFVLAVFSAEYIIRLVASPQKIAFLTDKYNLIDFIAIAPFFLGLGNPSAIRTLRFFRLLRLARLFKTLRLYKAFKFRGTILQRITPLVLALTSLKVVLIYLESIGLWFDVKDTGILFTIMGFALGVVLSSKVAITYKKYIGLEDSLFKIQGKLGSMSFNIDSFKAGEGTRLIKKWTESFVEIMNGDDKGSMQKLTLINKELYLSVKDLGNSELIPHHRLAALLKEIFSDASFIVGRKTTYVPEAYDRLLQQVLLIYLFLIALFIPGVPGLLAAVLGTYLLYGLYYVTLDLDLSDSDKKISLIKLEPVRLNSFILSLKK